MATSMSSVSLTARPRMAAGKTRAPLRVVAQQAREGVSAKVAKVAKAASVAGAVLASTPAAHAAVQEVAQIAEVNTVAVAAVGTGAIVGLAAVLAADPEKRCVRSWWGRGRDVASRCKTQRHVVRGAPGRPRIDALARPTR